MREDLGGFLERAKHLADIVRSAGTVAVVSHIDADGISSAAIARGALERMGLHPRHIFLKSLGEPEVEAISTLKEDLIWICDLGASAYSRLNLSNCIVTDHHQFFGEGQASLDLFSPMDRMLNPLLFGFKGSSHLSGAGCTYFVAKYLDPSNEELSYLAIVGAVGDMQDREGHKLEGPLHAIVIQDAVGKGILTVEPDELPFFGWTTRTAASMIAYSNELKAVGCACGFHDVRDMFEEGGIATYRKGKVPPAYRDQQTERYLTWSELDRNSRNIMKVLLRDKLEKNGIDPGELDKLLGDVYLFPGYPQGPSREAKEFATVLNASGRYILNEAPVPKQADGVDTDNMEEKDRDIPGEIIIRNCLDPVNLSSSALDNLRVHRENLREGISRIAHVDRLKNVQCLQSDKDSIRLEVNDTILGIIVGMMLDQSTPRPGLEIDPELPVIAMAVSTEDRNTMSYIAGSTDAADESPVANKTGVRIKVSGRMKRDLVERGLNLGEAMKQAALKVNGTGGGHDVAAGATIPEKKMSAFKKALDKEIGGQRSRSTSSARP
ncbi:MAG: DHH family phosphoesterase [Methanomassiliicoccales archaeon]|nr:DHH family phosphoesterase [Methanomassiliicoccales archaeon]